MTVTTETAPSVGASVAAPTSVLISPDLATEWLKRNKANRTIRPARVAQYAKDMASDSWFDTGETIKFDWNGDMVDGQHRLTAVIESGVVLPMRVLFGLDPVAKEYVDTGAARTANDALRMRGEAASAILAGAARLGYLIESGQKSVRISHATVFEFIEAHPGLREAAEATYKMVHKISAPPSVIAYSRHRIVEVDAEAGAAFIDKLANLNDLAADDPILRLAQRLRQLERVREKVDKQTMTITILRTWNAWRQGKKMQRVLLAAPDAALPDLV